MEVLTMKPTPERHPSVVGFPWPEEGISGAMLFADAFSWEADLVKGSNVDI